MKIRSRGYKQHDPLDEGTKFLAYTQSEILSHHYGKVAVPGSLKLAVTVQAGQITTEISFLRLDGSMEVRMNVENVDDVLED